MESLVVWTLVAAAVVALLRRSRSVASLVVAGALVAATAAGHARWSARRAVADARAAQRAATVPQADTRGEGDGRGYVSSDACGACHPSEYASWHRSFHRTMTQPATAHAALAPFAGETLTADDGRRYRLERRGDELWADISGNTGAVARQLGLMTGSHHMQAYWLPDARGNEQVEFPFTYLLDDHRWVARRDVFLVGQEYSKAPSRWNRICIECHVTGGQPRIDDVSDVPQSRVAELGIACEACHGPAGKHVAANRNPWRRLSLHLGDGADATIVNPARLPPERASEVCGQCHGIGCPPQTWTQDGIAYRPGQTLKDTKPILELATLAQSNCRRQIAADATFGASRYWSDGMVRVSGREYNGLIGSPCYRRGKLSCLSCHSMHESEPDK
ncbi:MAG TPA: multiheme c-type cytochrome, partial [Polyangia bacterium]|nr:multiheme c-type cytochrome [Polyangia bacterium]